MSQPTTPCPICSQPLKRVRQPSGSLLNSDQFDAIRVGDWYCATCENPASRSGYRYFWDKDLNIPSDQVDAGPMGCRFTRVFGAGPVLLPVIHIAGLRQAFEAAKTAIAAGCPGVWVINQGISVAPAVAVKVARAIQEEIGVWVGINLLGHTRVSDVIDTCAHDGFFPNGVWTDYLDKEFQSSRDYWNGLYFGGVAFKYRDSEMAMDNVFTAVQSATIHADVVLTTGSATGKPASVTKVHALRDGLAWHPGGLASGITPGNVDDVLQLVDVLLVATGIESEFGVFDPGKMRELQLKVGAEKRRRIMSVDPVSVSIIP